MLAALLERKKDALVESTLSGTMEPTLVADRAFNMYREELVDALRSFVNEEVVYTDEKNKVVAGVIDKMVNTMLKDGRDMTLYELSLAAVDWEKFRPTNNPNYLKVFGNVSSKIDSGYGRFKQSFELKYYLQFGEDVGVYSKDIIQNYKLILSKILMSFDVLRVDIQRDEEIKSMVDLRGYAVTKAVSLSGISIGLKMLFVRK